MVIGTRLVAVSGLILAACVGTESVEEPEYSPSAHRAADPPAAGNAVTEWHALANELLFDVGPVISSRAFAILQAAVHDAVNGVERRYEPYTAELASPGASLDAAVATAAREVLVVFAADHRERIDSAYAAALGHVPDGPTEDGGVALGRRAAQANLERRAGDGVPVGPWPPSEGPLTEPVYVPTGEPGDYAFTPPFDRPPLGPIALFPGWGRLAPFGIDLENHQVKGPDRLSGPRYARDLDLLKSIGRLHGSTRTADQTDMAFFWFEPEPTWNRVANDVIRRNELDAWEAARVLALLQFAMVDASIASFEGKYRFRFWRPYTAIRRADADGNRHTEAEKEWLPLLWTDPDSLPPTFIIPPIPEYPSAAAGISAAAAEVLSRHLGHRQAFETTSPYLPGKVRRFESFGQAAHESGMSRVYGGIHFLRAVEDGFEQGRGIGRVIGRMLAPVGR
jgi:hypothetical protein